jgi:hypothetical protein
MIRRAGMFAPLTRPILAVCIALLANGLDGRAEEPGKLTADETDFFEKRIRPVLVEHCYECHSAAATPLQGGLLLDSRDAARKGGESGHAVVPGDTNASLILAALKYDQFEMPPDGKLPESVIVDFEKWIRMGAPDPRDTPPESLTPKAEKAIDWEQARQFWAFRRPERHDPPLVSQPGWVRTPLDAFVLARQDNAGVSPNEPADPRTLVRRLSFDLIGLPPSPEEIAAFVSHYERDPQEAIESAVDRLLDSPHYGERWAALWLDVMRYSEDQAHIVGSNKELFFPNAYRYRDWVIEAFNSDLPYDEFLRLQLAADVLHPDEPSLHVALGFVGLGPKYYRRNSPEVMAEEWENHVDTLSQGLLGLTVACARCHDHKFDPITTEDYYALAGVFAGVEMYNRPLDESKKLGKNGQAEKPDEALHVIRDKTDPIDLNVMIRGDVNNKGPVVPRGFVQVLCDGGRVSFAEGSGRRELAEAIASPANPLTARVIVNRVWGQMFGRPLVETPSNFGALGSLPSHPELLDDLAVRFMEQGWSLKWLQREIALSATYRQSSRIDTAKDAADPANLLLWRMPRRRLSVEQFRDAVLASSGRLDRSIGGPSIDPAQPQESRRTVYSERSRLELNDLLKLFDAPDPNVHAARRVETITPLQKLFAFNSPFMVEQSQALAKRVTVEAGNDLEDRVQRAYALLFGRPASDDEMDLARSFLSGMADDGKRCMEYVQVLLASNELLMLD